MSTYLFPFFCYLFAKRGIPNSLEVSFYVFKAYCFVRFSLDAKARGHAISVVRVGVEVTNAVDIHIAEALVVAARR